MLRSVVFTYLQVLRDGRWSEQEAAILRDASYQILIWFYDLSKAFVGMIIELVVMYPIQRSKYRSGIDNLLVLLIGGIPIAMPTVLSVTMAIGSHKLFEQGAITKRMTAIEEMARMDVLCSDKTDTLTLNKLTVDKSLVESMMGYGMLSQISFLHEVVAMIKPIHDAEEAAKRLMQEASQRGSADNITICQGI
ncbi:hypothetical protein Fmac_026223 [Flemingia macrophylla]|uniref:Uncharacterized protein n=1 Tax=Flemingia macrophylla TaxID=520843 RepID=A0ABD1LE87_9FABA